jgi:hypothetical protein
MKHHWIRGVALGVALTVASSAAAQSTELSAEAKSHFDLGVKLHSEDDMRGALVEFGRAYDLSKRWSILYNIGQCSYELADYAGALRAFERYLAEGGEQVPEARRQKLAQDEKELRERVARVSVTTNVPGAEVAVDDEVVGHAPVRSYLVNLGRHRVTVSKDGYVGATKNIELAGGDAPDLSLELKPVVAEPPPASAAAARSSNRPLLIAGLAVTGVGTAGGHHLRSARARQALRGHGRLSQRSLSDPGALDLRRDEHERHDLDGRLRRRRGRGAPDDVRARHRVVVRRFTAGDGVESVGLLRDVLSADQSVQSQVTLS